MTINSKDSLIEEVQKLMGVTYSAVTNDGYNGAIDQALRELGWTLPETDNRKCFWLIERSKRYVIEVLLTESAHKFKVKQIHLDQRFKHYFDLLKMKDDTFLKAIDEEDCLFDLGTSSLIVAQYLTTGFEYDRIGRDISYTGW